MEHGASAQSFAHNEQLCTIFTQFAHFHTQRKRTEAGRRPPACFMHRLSRVNYFAENALIIQQRESAVESALVYALALNPSPAAAHVCMFVHYATAGPTAAHVSSSAIPGSVCVLSLNALSSLRLIKIVSISRLPASSNSEESTRENSERVGLHSLLLWRERNG